MDISHNRKDTGLELEKTESETQHNQIQSDLEKVTLLL